MARLKQSVFLSSLVACILLPLGACSNSPWANRLEQSLAADPRLQTDTQAGQTQPSPATDSTTAQLPANFPAEIPRYPNAELVAVTGATGSGQAAVTVGENQSVETRWQTADPPAQVQQFYQTQFQTEGWQLLAGKAADRADAAPTAQSIQATRDGLQVNVAVSPGSSKTEFVINYQFGQVGEISGTSGESGATNPESTANSGIPQPGDPNFIGPVLPSQTAQTNGSTTNGSTTTGATSTSFSDLNQAPAELRPYISDLARLGVFSAQPAAEDKSTTGSEFKPNAEISRRDYARWLVTANNLIYASQPARKIRLAAATDKPAFHDVPSSDPDFATIQGLANAGLIPSSLSNDAASVSFRPDAPLTREALILWKVPVDLRQALPNASIDTIQQTWGFQDAAKIEPRAMRAVLADYQNGDLSNIRRAFGYTTLFQPQKTVSRAEAAAVLWQFGSEGNNLSAKDAMQMSQSAPSPSAE